MAKRTASATWDGGLTDGDGRMSFGTFEGNYSFTSRFEDGEGTNPEELIGAALAGCFSMQLAADLGRADHSPESVTTNAGVHLTKAEGGGFEISKIELDVSARVPGIGDDEFSQVVETAQANCLVSKALGGVGEITVDARLEG
jgi:osmotically inducible protein OsmC